MVRKRVYGNRWLLGPVGEEAKRLVEISSCFIRRGHSCGKSLGASKSCFIACPSTDDVKIMLGLIQEKLTKMQVDPIIAIRERAYGQDIFCTKICGRIIEAQFCIVILDDSVKRANGSGISIPVPNVYYEYGLMTGLGKYVIPLQKEGQELAFNIKTHDTIRYTPGNLSDELDRALKTAARIAEEDRSVLKTGGVVSEDRYADFLEISGFEKKGRTWFLSDDVEDTVFTGFGHVQLGESILFTVVRDKAELEDCLVQIRMVRRRLQTRRGRLGREYDENEGKIKEASVELERLKEKPAPEGSDYNAMLSRMSRNSEVSQLTTRIEGLKKERLNALGKIARIEQVKFVVILQPDVVTLKERCEEEIRSAGADGLQLPVIFGDTSGVQIGDIRADFHPPEL